MVFMATGMAMLPEGRSPPRLWASLGLCSGSCCIGYTSKGWETNENTIQISNYTYTHISISIYIYIYIYSKKNKGPDNPTCQILPIMGNKCCSGTGKAGKTKEVVEDREVKQVVCEELCVTKLYVKDGVWQSGVKDGVWKRCVKDGVWKMVCGKVQLHVAKCHACHAKSRGDHGGTWEPGAPPEPAQCHTYHAYHVKRRWMSQSATPATQSAATCRQVPRLPRKKPRRPRRLLGTERATRASPVPYVPCLPRETKVDVSKCHACHAKCSYMSPSATPATQKAAASTATAGNRARHQSQPSAIRATPATWNEGGCLKVPGLPRETKVDASKCHTCHAKCSYMSPSAAPATQKAAASTATAGNRARHQSQSSAIRGTPATWDEGGCLKVPRLPRKVQLHVAKRHACHAKSRGVHVPRLPRETKVDVSKCHACHAKSVQVVCE